MTQLHFTRRALLGGAAALSAAGAAGASGFSLGARDALAAAAPKLPARGNFVIRKAYVMTMEKDGDITSDELERAEKDLERVTHEHVAEIDRMLQTKEQELLSV